MSRRWPWQGTGSHPPTLVVVGPTHFDLLLTLPRLPRPNDRLVPSDVALEPGGMGGNVASAFARLGGLVRYAGTFPADDGPLLRAALERDGVDVRFACRRPAPPSRGLILVGQRGERAIIGGGRRLFETRLWPIDAAPAAPPTPHPAKNGLAGPVPPRPDPPDEVSRWRSIVAGPWELGTGALASPVDAFYCPAVFAPSVLPSLPPELPLAIDVEARHTDGMAPDDLRALLGRASLVFGNDGVLAGVADSLGYADVADLSRDVKGTLVVTLGARGCLVVGDATIHVPGFRVRPVDTTGAGDCFAAAFTLGALRGLDPRQAATFANAAAALSTRGLGCRASTPSLHDVTMLLERRARSERRAARELDGSNPTENSTTRSCKALQLWHNGRAGRSQVLSPRQTSPLRTPLEV